MKISMIVFAFVLLAQSCGKDPDPPVSQIGHMKIYVTVPVPLFDEKGELVGAIPSPAEGITSRLYQSEARCLGYKDAGLGIAYADSTLVFSKYTWRSDKDGVVRFNNVKAGKYYLTVYFAEMWKYSEIVIDIPIGDTLILHKDFTALMEYATGLEPWDEPYPEY